MAPVITGMKLGQFRGLARIAGSNTHDARFPGIRWFKGEREKKKSLHKLKQFSRISPGGAVVSVHHSVEPTYTPALTHQNLNRCEKVAPICGLEKQTRVDTLAAMKRCICVCTDCFT